ncbi:hypothetical protein BH09ACT11_BH09ACT11_22800 [soil metagenome]
MYAGAWDRWERWCDSRGIAALPSEPAARSDAFAAAEALWEPVYLSADAQEGPRAFAEKRRPRWQGR